VSGRLQDKVALITGGALVIGHATCLLFAREGAAVAALDRDAAGVRACAAEIAELGGRAIGLEADVTQSRDTEQAVAACEDRLGGVDILINNAGVIGGGTVETTPEAEWHRILNINLTGVYLMSKATIPALRRRGSGSIINVSSAAGLAGWYDQAAYDASKGGVVNLTRSMALDFAREGIRVNCLVPAHVTTPMSQNFQAASSAEGATFRAQVLSAIPMGRFSTPDEIAYAALFLASSESSYVTGSMLVVDGGYLAR
jgi:NAD(P)-dependent dehydrogenase (short-subunit alcohol dehydrogenase family)